MNARSKAVTNIITLFLASFFVLWCVKKYGLIPYGTLPLSGILTERNYAEANKAVKSQLSDNTNLMKNEEDDEASVDEDDYDKDLDEYDDDADNSEELEIRQKEADKDKQKVYDGDDNKDDEKDDTIAEEKTKEYNNKAQDFTIDDAKDGETSMQNNDGNENDEDIDVDDDDDDDGDRVSIINRQHDADGNSKDAHKQKERFDILKYVPKDDALEDNKVNVRMIETLKGENAPSEEDRKLGYCQKRRFKDGVPFTALTSIPGSGNTWMRFLMEQVTGIYTTSAYCDGKLKRGGFFGECLGRKPGAGRNSTLGFKIHVPRTIEIYDKCVLVIRNPLKSTAAELQRRSNHDHTGVANIAEVTESKIENMLYKWAQFHYAWFNFTKPMLIVLYDDLHENLRSQLERLCHFFNAECNKKLLDCIIANSEGNFRRPEHDESNIFTKEHYQLAKKLMQKVLARVNEYMPHNKRKELIL